MARTLLLLASCLLVGAALARPNSPKHPKEATSSVMDILTGNPNDKIVLAVGGYSGSAVSTVFLYNIKTKTWSSAAALPMGLNDQGIGLVRLKDNHGTHDSVITTGGDTAGIPFDTCLFLDHKDVSTNGQKVLFKSDKVANMNSPRNYHATANVGTAVYVLGGTLDGSASGVTDTVEKFDGKHGAKGKWVKQKPMTTRRLYVTAAVIKDDIYVIGGEDSSGPAAVVERFTTTNQHWKTVASLNTARLAPTASSAGGKIYCAGGQGSNSAADRFDTVEEYNPHKNTWTLIANMNVERSFAAQVTLPDGQVFVCGGVNEVYYMECELYDPKHPSKGWTTGPSMPSGVDSFPMIVV